MIWHTRPTLEMMQKRSENTMVSHLGMEFVEVGDDYLIMKMPVDQRTHQPIGIMHGGASCALAESAGSIAANYCVDIEKRYCVGLDINTNHIRAIKSGFVFAKATPYHLGQTTHVWNIEIRDERERLISVNRLTMAVLQRKRG